MKGIYFSQIRDDKVYQGAVLKVLDEIKAFREEGYEMKHVNIPPASTGFRKTHIGKGICAAIPFTFIFSKYDYEASYDGYDFYYFRFEAADYWFIRFLRKLRKNNPASKILIELPNYPNVLWMVMPWCFPLLLKDIFARRKYKRYIDRFVVLDPKYNKIYQVPTVTYINGIDVSRIVVRRPKEDNNRIDIIGVATMFPPHGYDRMIESLHTYYSNGGDRDIVFHVVGEGPGPELPKYKEMVEKYKLTDHVEFEGTLFGESLRECYNKCDIALEDLAEYRMGLRISSSLKSREYLSYGLPIITGCDIDVLMGKDFKYVLQFANDDSPINTQSIIDFYDEIYGKECQQSVIDHIRQFADENCTYRITLKNVFEYIGG